MTLPSKCGTDSGYMRHRRLGEPIDDDCRRAHNLANKHRRIDRCTRCGSWRWNRNCHTCQDITEREPEWVLRGGIWRDKNKASA